MTDPTKVPVEPQPPSGPLNTEPVATLSAVYGAVAAILALITTFGLTIDPSQKEAILGAIGALYILVQAFHIRSIVWSPHSVKKVEQVAKAAGAAAEAAKTP